jgi:hypothetical protein
MVKETPKAAVKKVDGSTPKRRPGKPPRPGEVRTEKLVMRVHPDLMAVLTERAREKGETRSAYVEKLLVGWVRLDPRNRRVDMIGKYVEDAPDPRDPKRMSSFGYHERWRKFNNASRLLLGAPPPSDWLPDEEGGDPADHRQQPDDDIEENDDPPRPIPPSFRRRR